MGRLSNAWKKVKKAAKKVVNTVKKIVKACKDIYYKMVGFGDFLASLIGIRPKKYLRLKVIILTENGVPVIDEKIVNDWYQMTKKIMLEKCNIEVRSPNLSIPAVTVAPSDAPAHALDCECSFGATFNDDNDYYSTLTNYGYMSASSALADLFGYGEPFYVIVNKEITGKKAGCSSPLIMNYAVVSLEAGATTIAHEFGHVAWLFKHSNESRNLMNTATRDRDRDYELTRWQISKIRNSRYVIYAPRRG